MEMEGQVFALLFTGTLSRVEGDPQCEGDRRCWPVTTRYIANWPMAVQQNRDFLLWLRLFNKKSYWQEVSAENDFLKRLAKLLLDLHRTVIYAPLRAVCILSLRACFINICTA